MQRPVIQVRTLRPRFSFDGETGILVLAGTGGQIDAMTLKKEGSDRDGIAHMRPLLTVFWDACVLQAASNDEPSTYEGWQESDIDPADLEFVSAAPVDTPTEGMRP